MDGAVQGTAKGLEMTAKGRQMVMATTAELTGQVVQKEAVRKLGVGVKHRLHLIIDDMVEVFESLPTSWRILWVTGALILLVAGFTVLIVIPGSFTVLIALWTFLVVRLAGVGGADVLENDNKTFANPMDELIDSVDVRYTNPLAAVDPTSDSSGPSSATIRLADVEEEVIGRTAGK